MKQKNKNNLISGDKSTDNCVVLRISEKIELVVVGIKWGSFPGTTVLKLSLKGCYLGKKASKEKKKKETMNNGCYV